MRFGSIKTSSLVVHRIRSLLCPSVYCTFLIAHNLPQCVKLSAFAAQTLVDAKQLDMKTLDPHRMCSYPGKHRDSLVFLGPKEYDVRKTITDPISGGMSAIFWTITQHYTGIAQIFTLVFVGHIQIIALISQAATLRKVSLKPQLRYPKVKVTTMTRRA